MLVRTAIWINEKWACYKIWLGCSPNTNQLLFEINKAVAIYASKGLSSFCFEWIMHPNISFFFLLITARSQPVHSQSCGTQPVVNHPVSYNSVLSRTELSLPIFLFSVIQVKECVFGHAASLKLNRTGIFSYLCLQESGVMLTKSWVLQQC